MANGHTQNQYKKVTAPYNFIFASRIVIKEKDTPDYSGIQLNSGEIHVICKAETPIFIGNGKGDFFKGANGKEMIPGSTIRGMVRANMQILGYGKIGNDLEDYKIYFRDMTSGKHTVHIGLKNYYTAVVGVESKSIATAGGKKATVSLAHNVRAGYLAKKGDTYQIYPTEYIRIAAGHKDLETRKDHYLKTEPVWYQNDGSELSFTQVKDWYKGVMLFTGKAVGKPNAKYIFKERTENGEVFTLTKEDILNYEVDYKMRARVNQAGKQFWSLPKEGEEKPIFYIRHEGNTYFGMSKFVRIAHKNPISHGIPESHNTTEPTFVEGILGYTGEHDSRSSRVSFGDFVLTKKVHHPSFKTILGEPKPSFFPTYIKKSKHYSEDIFEISGYKKYWMKEFHIPPQNIKNANVATTISPVGKKSEFKGIIRFKNLKDVELGLLLWSLQLEEGCYQNIGMGKNIGLGRMHLKINQLMKDTNEYTYDNFCTPRKEVMNGNDYITQYKEFVGEIITGQYDKAKKKKSKQSIEEKLPIKDFIYMQQKIVTREEDILDMGLTNGKITGGLQTVQELREKWESDFHGENKLDIKLGVGKGELCVPDSILDVLLNK
ncbi:MAG: TIGR03986 family CRISPR-associated RAMP protein [Eubacteriales bacterium]